MTNRSANVFSTELNGMSELGEGFMSRMTEATCQRDAVLLATREVAAGSCKGYSGPELLHLTITLRDWRSFTEQPAGSNSTEQLLSEVSRRTEIRFLIRFGETRTLLRVKGPGSRAMPVVVTGSKEPLPTTIEEGEGYRGSDAEDRVPVAEGGHVRGST
jgi:hypothetical protein